MSVTEAAVLRCPARRKRDGQPCTGKQTASGFCVAHDPRANEWRKQGGAASSTANRAAKLMPSRLRPLVEKLEATFDELYSGDRPRPAQLRAAAIMATVAMAIAKLIQVGEYEARIQQLEAAAARAEAERPAPYGGWQ